MIFTKKTSTAALGNIQSFLDKTRGQITIGEIPPIRRPHFAPNVAAAFIIRFLGGLMSGNGAVIQGYIADVTPPERMKPPSCTPRTRSFSGS